MSNYNDRNPRARRGFLFGAVIVGVLIVIAVVLVVSFGLGGGGVPPATATPEPSTSASPVDDADASACGLDVESATDSVTAPPEAEWVIVGTMAAPQSDGVGPGQTDVDGFRSCYAHTPEGALFAAANILAMGTDATLSSQIADRLVVPGPGRDAALQASTTAEAGGLSAQIAGFRILAYDATDATVDLAFQLNTGGFVSFPLRLKWSEGDWKLVLADDGGPSVRPSALQSLGGYIPWRGI